MMRLFAKVLRHGRVSAASKPAVCFAVGLAAITLQPTSGSAQAVDAITTTTSDGVAIHGEAYFGSLDRSAPLVLLFHQGGSSGRGEYADLAPWLNDLGFRAIAWDQRSGGSGHGVPNRTAANLPEGTPAGFCDATPDLQAALDYVVTHDLAERVVVWGSSYSGALVFHLAADNPDRVRGVVAFSPASGGPLADCLARARVGEIEAPMLAVRPASEMERDSSREQRGILTDAGVEFHVVEHGVHGSSMLLDARTGEDMSAARTTISDWLARVVG